MLRRLKQELKRLFYTKQTWLLVAVIVLGPVLIVTDFFGIGTRVYDTTISNVLILHPARLSLYISAFSLMAFTLLQLQKLYNSSMYTILEATVDPLTQIVLQTVAIGIITIASVCVSILVLYPYTALTMGTLFSFLKFIRTWVYVYLIGMLITLLISSGIFLIFRNFEVSLIFMSALMLFSVGQSEESYYLVHWLQTSVTSIADGTESTLRFKVMLSTRLVGVLISIGIYTVGLLCIRRYSRGIPGSVIKNICHAVIPFLLVFSLVACGFYTNNDPLYWQDKNDVTSLMEYYVDEETQTIEVDDSADTEYRQRMHDHEEQFNIYVKWLEMDTEIVIERDRLRGKTTFLLDNRSKDLKEQELTIELIRGIEPTEILCNGQPLDFSVGDFNFVDWYYYHFTLPAGLDDVTLEVFFAGFPKGSTDTTEIIYSITEQYVELSDECPELMTSGSDVRNYTLSLSEDLTFIISGIEAEEVTPVAEGYRTYTFIQDRREFLLYYYIFAGDYCGDTTKVGDLEVEFYYFKNKAGIMQEIDAMEIIEDTVAYFTDLYGPLEFGDEPLIIAEIERDSSSSWQIYNFCGIPESALVSSLYQAKQDSPDASRSAGLQSLVEVIAKQWWSSMGYGAYIDFNLSDAFTNYSTYLYMKDVYGEAYVQEALVEPWYKTARFQQNEFYWCNKQYTSILPLEDALEIYSLYQTQEKKDIYAAALFHVEELVGGEEMLTEKLVEIYDTYKGGLKAYYKKPQYLDYALFLVKMGITPEEFEAW